jgi:hypothetical protein
MEIKTGARLRSVADTTEVVVVKAPAGDVDLRCGGHPMAAVGGDAESAETVDGFGDGTQVGKRYADEDAGVELLCTKAGTGSLSVGEAVLPIKGAKALPSSD